MTGTNGYSYANVSSLETSDENNEIYIKTSQEKANAMWLASPSSNIYRPDIVYAYCSGYLDSRYYHGNDAGLRPLVCLKSGIQLEKIKDGEYKIK